MTVGATIENVVFPTSLAGPSTPVTLTSAALVPGPLTVHANAPVVAVAFCTEGAITSHEVPLSRDNSIRTYEFTPRLCDQVIERVDPTLQMTAVFGDVTAIDGLAAIENVASETSVAVSAVPLCAVTRTIPCCVAAVGVHAQLVADPGSPTHPVTFEKELPPFRDSVTSNEVAPEPVH